MRQGIEFKAGDRVWIAPPPLRCRRRFDLGTVQSDDGLVLIVQWDRCGRLKTERWINHPPHSIRHIDPKEKV